MQDLVVVFETHATSLDNEAGLASGWFDIALSATGEGQARSLGVRRREDDLAAVFCSDLTRAFRTAEIGFGGTALNGERHGSQGMTMWPLMTKWPPAAR